MPSLNVHFGGEYVLSQQSESLKNLPTPHYNRYIEVFYKSNREQIRSNTDAALSDFTYALSDRINQFYIIQYHNNKRMQMHLQRLNSLEQKAISRVPELDDEKEGSIQFHQILDDMRIRGEMMQIGHSYSISLFGKQIKNVGEFIEATIGCSYQITPTIAALSLREYLTFPPDIPDVFKMDISTAEKLPETYWKDTRPTLLEEFEANPKISAIVELVCDYIKARENHEHVKLSIFNDVRSCSCLFTIINLLVTDTGDSTMCNLQGAITDDVTKISDIQLDTIYTKLVTNFKVYESIKSMQLTYSLSDPTTIVFITFDQFLADNIQFIAKINEEVGRKILDNYLRDFYFDLITNDPSNLKLFENTPWKFDDNESVMEVLNKFDTVFEELLTIQWGKQDAGGNNPMTLFDLIQLALSALYGKPRNLHFSSRFHASRPGRAVRTSLPTSH